MIRNYPRGDFLRYTVVVAWKKIVQDSEEIFRHVQAGTRCRHFAAMVEKKIHRHDNIFFNRLGTRAGGGFVASDRRG